MFYKTPLQKCIKEFTEIAIQRGSTNENLHRAYVQCEKKYGEEVATKAVEIVKALVEDQRTNS